MPYPAVDTFATFDVTAGTEGRSFDQVLWDALWAKSRLLEVFGKGPKIENPIHIWQSLEAPPMYVVAQSGNVLGSGSKSNTTLVVTDASKVTPGAVLMNVSRRTPIGTYQRDEVLLVTDVNTSTNTLTVKRDAGGFHTAGSAAHAAGDRFLIMYVAKEEGSLYTSDANQAVKRTQLTNGVVKMSRRLEMTVDQMERRMEVVANDFERQWNNLVTLLKNDLVNMAIYGAAESVNRSDTNALTCKGLLQLCVENINSVNPLVDYTTTSLSASAINDMFERLRMNGADPSEQYVIITSPKGKRALSALDYSIIKEERKDEMTIGREVVAFKSDLGFSAEIIDDPLVRPNNIFIVRADYVQIVPFIDWRTAERTWEKTADDIYGRRVMGSFTVEVVNPGFSHACFTNLNIT